MRLTQTVAALCKRHAQSPQGKEPEAPSTWRGRLARRLFILLATLTLPAPAQLDTNNTGMSDVWERHFNNGNLFDPENPAHHPHADPDGDGWTNLEEFIAGTDPFSGNPPEGMVATHITHLPDQPAAEGGIVDVAIISWDTLPGKQYTLQFSPDLTGQSWIAVDVPYAGDGTPEAVSITLTDSEGVAPDKLFWRVKVDDPNTDSDGDGLTDYEEYLLGSDPNNPDTSGDGVPDGWLVAHGYDPNVNHENIMFRDTGVTVPEAYLLGVQPNPDATLRDLDGDGLTNEQEAFLGTDPLVPDNPGILQEKISNGDFSEPAIGTGAREGAAWMAWDYWPSEKVKGWKAIEGDHIEFQTYRPLEAGNPYLELKAHPAGHTGVKQQVGSRKGARYLLLFDCRANPDIDPEKSNFTVKIDDSELAVVEFDSNTEWEERIYAFEAANVITEIQFIPASSEHATRGGFIDNVRLRRVVVEDTSDSTGVDDEPLQATGVDAMSLEVDSDDIGYQPDYWIMAPLQGPPLAGGHAYENLTHLKMEEIPDTNAELIVNNATPNPESFALDGNFHEIRWQGGNGTGVNDESRVSIKLDDVEEEYEVNVRVKTMKHRTVMIQANRVHRQNANTRAYPSMNWGLLENKVNEYLAYQLNAWFNLQFAGMDVNYTYEGDFMEVKPNRQVTDIYGFYDLLDDENLQLNENYDIRVLLLDEINLIEGLNNEIVYGYAPLDGGPNTCVVLVRQLGQNPRSLDELAFTIAHEIGHVMLGAGHPDEGHGVAPFPSLQLADHQKRLMCSGPNHILGTSRLLVKAEWDKAEDWLKNRPRGDN